MDILFEKVYTLVTITPQGVRRKLEVQDMGLNLSGMTTETRNPRTMQLDQMSPLEIVTVMNEEDARVPLAIAKCRSRRRSHGRQNPLKKADGCSIWAPVPPAA